MTRRILALAVLVVAASPAAATAATGTATIAPSQVVAGRAHLEFPLPSGYKQVVGAMAGTPALGSFRRDDSGACRTSLNVTGRITATAPTRKGKRLKSGDLDLRLDRFEFDRTHGHYLGAPWAADDDLAMAGVAVMRAPRDLATTRSRWLVVTARATLTGCATPAARERGMAGVKDALWRAARTVRVVDGPAKPPEDVEVVVA